MIGLKERDHVYSMQAHPKSNLVLQLLAIIKFVIRCTKSILVSTTIITSIANVLTRHKDTETFIVTSYAISNRSNDTDVGIVPNLLGELA